MSVSPGDQLLHYRLIEKIGEGGMGVVWKALDTTLDREVAIKVLPDSLADDQERLTRLEREAKLLASLNHPNIAVVHGLHEHAARHFLVRNRSRCQLSHIRRRFMRSNDTAFGAAMVTASL